jgi:hypothetical protein
MRITAGGLVGIGTSAPDRALEINHATGLNLRLTYNDSDGSAATFADLLVSSAGILNIISSSATIKHGAADSAAPVAQTIAVSSVVAGTNNTSGVVTTFTDSAGTGDHGSGGFVFKVAPAGTPGTSQNTFATALTIDSTKAVTFAGDIVQAVAKVISIASGTNKRAGNATLGSGGTVDVSNTTVTANTIVILTRKTSGGTIGTVNYTVTAGSKFTITSDNTLDTSTFSYLLIENP